MIINSVCFLLISGAVHAVRAPLLPASPRIVASLAINYFRTIRDRWRGQGPYIGLLSQDVGTSPAQRRQLLGRRCVNILWCDGWHAGKSIDCKDRLALSLNYDFHSPIQTDGIRPVGPYPFIAQMNLTRSTP